jgi:carbonic anhydrase
MGSGCMRNTLEELEIPQNTQNARGTLRMGHTSCGTLRMDAKRNTQTLRMHAEHSEGVQHGHGTLCTTQNCFRIDVRALRSDSESTENAQNAFRRQGPAQK